MNINFILQTNFIKLLSLKFLKEVKTWVAMLPYDRSGKMMMQQHYRKKEWKKRDDTLLRSHLRRKIWSCCCLSVIVVQNSKWRDIYRDDRMQVVLVFCIKPWLFLLSLSFLSFFKWKLSEFTLRNNNFHLPFCMSYTSTTKQQLVVRIISLVYLISKQCNTFLSHMIRCKQILRQRISQSYEDVSLNCV